MPSPIETLIDKACGVGEAARPRWHDEAARRMLYNVADALYEKKEYKASSFLYYSARHAKGMRSERAFRTLLMAAFRKCRAHSASDDVFSLEKWVADVRRWS